MDVLSGSPENFVLYHLPTAAMAYLYRFKIVDDVTGIAAAITNAGSFQLREFFIGDSSRHFGPTLIFSASNNNWPAWLSNLTNAPDDDPNRIGHHHFSPDGHGGFFLNPSAYVTAYTIPNYFQPFWIRLVDGVNNEFKIDKKITNLLAKKTIANTVVIPATKKIKQRRFFTLLGQTVSVGGSESTRTSLLQQRLFTFLGWFCSYQ